MRRLVATAVRVGDRVRTRYVLCLTCSTRAESKIATSGCLRNHHLVGEHPDVLPPLAFRPSKDV